MDHCTQELAVAMTASTRSAQVQTIQPGWGAAHEVLPLPEKLLAVSMVSVCFRDANPEKLPLLPLVALYQSHTGSTK